MESGLAVFLVLLLWVEVADKENSMWDGTVGGASTFKLITIDYVVEGSCPCRQSFRLVKRV